MTKLSLLLLIYCFGATMFAQKPGDDIFFGKYDKNEKKGLLKKLPEHLHSVQKENPIDLNMATIQCSRVFKGDTVGMSHNGYYVEFIPEHVSAGSPVYSYLSDYVSNEDWNVFRSYVRDSIARRILSAELGADGWLIPVYGDHGDNLPEEEWKLDWRTELNLNDPWGDDMYSFLSILHYPEFERFNKSREVDQRKLMYEYYWLDLEGMRKAKRESGTNDDNVYLGRTDYSKYVVKEVCAVYRDSTVWIKDTSLTHFGNLEDGLVLHYNSHEEFKEMPVVGISQPQARAYLHWLENLHNEKLKREGILYTVDYELPSTEQSGELPEVLIPSFELDSWRISNKQYKAFVEYVRDSIALRILGETWGADGHLIPTYDDFLTEIPEYEWRLDWKGKIDWDRKTSGQKYGKGKQAPYGLLQEMFYYPSDGDTSLIDKRKLVYEFLFYDFKTAAIDMPKEEEEKGLCETYFGNEIEKTCLKSQAVECYRGDRFYGKGLDLSYVNSRLEDTDVFSHEDRSNFIVRDRINIYPGLNYRDFNKRCDKYCQWGEVYNYENPCKEYDCELCPQIEDWDTAIPIEYDFDTNPDAPVQGLTYYQYQAYWYWWRKERRKEVKGNPVISDYIPSEKEFIKLQKGETVIHPQEVHPLPTPTFNYVVKFYRIQPSTNN